jgi:EAL domain-containing protein (putative c-di-GMP-specific phosphodiesterase class I)
VTEPDLHSEIRRALAAGEFVLVYQPVVSLHDATIGSVEAFLRWRRTDGLLAAGAFLPAVSDPELIDALTKFVFDEAGEQAATWRRRFETWCFPVSVNIAPTEFTDSLVDRVSEVRNRFDLSSGALALDISEPVLLADPDASRRRIDALKQAGVQIVLDDFGITHATRTADHTEVDSDAGMKRSIDELMASLVALQGFSIDVVKVDRVLLDAGFADDREAAAIEAIVKLAHLLGFRVLAEGVESGDEAERLRAAGFDLGQGYYFQRPHGPGHIDRLLLDLAEARQAFASTSRGASAR